MMDFRSHSIRTIRKMNYKEVRSIKKSEYVFLAVVLVESWLRPISIRVPEYISMFFGFNLTLGLCQAKYHFWKQNYPTASRIRLLRHMENPYDCFGIVASYFIGRISEDPLIVTELYSGSKSVFYESLLIEATAIISNELSLPI